MQILHIGTEKTGTTHLQRFLAANAKTLKEKYSIQVRTTNGRNARSSDLVNLVADNPFSDLPSVENVNIDLNFNYQDQIISSEHFSSRLTNESELLKLREIVNNDNNPGRIVLYLKPQCELLVGMFAEAIKAGRKPEDLPTIKNIFERKRYGILYFDYEKLISLWRRIFFNYEIDVHLYDRSRMRNGDISRDFIGTYFPSIDHQDLISSSLQTNRTLSPEMLLSIDRFAKQLEDIPRYILINHLERHDPFAKGTFITRIEFEQFAEQLNSSNALLERELGIVISNELFESYRFIDRNYEIPLDIFSQIVNKIRKGESHE